MPTYGSGIDPFEARRLRERLLSMAEKKQAQSVGGYTGGPTAGQFGLMSATQPTAQESQAFTNRNIARSQYGDRWNTKGGIGRGGLEREKIAAETSQKREGLRSAESIAGTQAGAQTGVADIRARAARDVTGMEQERQRQQDIMRFHPGDAFTPQGLESRNLDILKQKNELDAQQQKMPKVFQQEGYDDRGVATNTYQMPVLDPETGQYVMQTLPQRQSGLGAAGNQGVASQGLKGIAQTAFKSPDEVANSNLSRAEKLKILREQFGME